MQAAKNYTGAPGDFAPEMQKRAPENRHRLQCKGLFNVADLANGMWKVAPQNKNLIFGLLARDKKYDRDMPHSMLAINEKQNYECSENSNILQFHINICYHLPYYYVVIN